MAGASAGVVIEWVPGRFRSSAGIAGAIAVEVVRGHQSGFREGSGGLGHLLAWSSSRFRRSMGWLGHLLAWSSSGFREGSGAPEGWGISWRVHRVGSGGLWDGWGMCWRGHQSGFREGSGGLWDGWGICWRGHQVGSGKVSELCWDCWGNRCRGGSWSSKRVPGRFRRSMGWLGHLLAWSSSGFREGSGALLGLPQSRWFVVIKAGSGKVPEVCWDGWGSCWRAGRVPGRFRRSTGWLGHLLAWSSSGFRQGSGALLILLGQTLARFIEWVAGRFRSSAGIAGAIAVEVVRGHQSGFREGSGGLLGWLGSSSGFWEGSVCWDCWGKRWRGGSWSSKRVPGSWGNRCRGGSWSSKRVPGRFRKLLASWSGSRKVPEVYGMAGASAGVVIEWVPGRFRSSAGIGGANAGEVVRVIKAGSGKVPEVCWDGWGICWRGHRVGSGKVPELCWDCWGKRWRGFVVIKAGSGKVPEVYGMAGAFAGVVIEWVPGRFRSSAGIAGAIAVEVVRGHQSGFRKVPEVCWDGWGSCAGELVGFQEGSGGLRDGWSICWRGHRVGSGKVPELCWDCWGNRCRGGSWSSRRVPGRFRRSMGWLGHLLAWSGNRCRGGSWSSKRVPGRFRRSAGIVGANAGELVGFQEGSGGLWDGWGICWRGHRVGSGRFRLLGLLGQSLSRWFVVINGKVPEVYGMAGASAGVVIEWVPGRFRSFAGIAGAIAVEVVRGHQSGFREGSGGLWDGWGICWRGHRVGSGKVPELCWDCWFVVIKAGSGKVPEVWQAGRVPGRFRRSTGWLGHLLAWSSSGLREGSGALLGLLGRTLARWFVVIKAGSGKLGWLGHLWSSKRVPGRFRRSRMAGASAGVVIEWVPGRFRSSAGIAGSWSSKRVPGRFRRSAGMAGQLCWRAGRVPGRFRRSTGWLGHLLAWSSSGFREGDAAPRRRSAAPLNGAAERGAVDVASIIKAECTPTYMSEYRPAL